jgi:hypothetical protein
MNKGKSAEAASATSLGLLILLVLSCFIGRSLKLFFTRAKVPVEFHTLVEDARFSGEADGTAQLWYVISRLEDVRRKVAKATGHRADITAPESQAVNNFAEAIEAPDTNSKATFEDIKYASSDMSTNASGKSNDSGKDTSKRGKHGRHQQGALKPAADVASDLSAIANLMMSARDRGNFDCRWCDKPSHCAGMALAPAPKRPGYSRSKSCAHGKGGKGGSADGGKLNSTANAAQLEIMLLKTQLEIKKLKSTQPASEVETPSPGVFN